MITDPTPALAPGPRGQRFFGSLSDFKADPIHTFLDGAREHGDVVRFTFGPMVAHLVRHPDGVKHVLQDNNHNYGRDTRGFEALRMAVGDSLLTTDGEPWRPLRRLSQPAFHRQRLAGFAAIMSDAAGRLVDEWRPGGELDVTPAFLKVTLRILGLSMFGIDLSNDADSIGRAVADMLHFMTDHMQSFIHIPRAIPTPANLRFRGSMRILDGVVYGMIADRRQRQAKSGERKNDLLGMLLEARDEETGKGLDDQQLRNELLTLLVAGHETTSMALSWSIYLLSLYPAARRALEAEARSVLAGRPAALEDLGRLKWTRMVLDESMRLYPPAWVVARSVIDDDVIGGYRIPAGSIVMMSPYVTHRSPALWEDPEGFDPERFAEGAPERPRYAYFPFGGGPHLCIGNSFALMEAQIVLATIAARWRLDLVPGHLVEPEPLITLRPKYGVVVTPRPVA